MATEPGKEGVGTPLDADRIDSRGIEEIVVEFDEGEEVLTPKINERFGSYDLNEAAPTSTSSPTTSSREVR
jgi:hypothetical protein